MKAVDARRAAAALALTLSACAGAEGPGVGEAALVADITPGPGGSNPYGLRPLGHIVLFDALQQEPWRTDGTRAGTLRLAQAGLRAGAAGATRFFAGEDLGHGTELWKTDGTAAGTVLVKDINPGPDAASYPGGFTEAAGTVFFLACDGVHGRELWKTDGTDAGTVMVKDIDGRPATGPPGSDSCLSVRPPHRDLRALNGRLYFLGDDGGAGVGLWQSDGTMAGTVLVRAVPREQPTSPRDVRGPVEQLTNAAGRLFFTTRSNLWVSDGTAAGTAALPAVSAPVVAGTPSLFFYVSGAGVGRSDGTAAGTYRVSDVYVPTGARFDTRTTQVAAVGDRLFFIAMDGSLVEELWTSDGTPEGTRAVMGLDGSPPAIPPEPFSLTAHEGSLYFVARDESHGRQLWRVDGSLRARRLTDLGGQVAPANDNGDEHAIAGLGPMVLFAGRDSEHGTELWGFRAR